MKNALRLGGWIWLSVLMLTSVELFSGPRIQTQTVVAPFSFPYTIDQTEHATLSVPAFPNPEGNLMGIKYEFVGTDNFSGGYQIPDLPYGGLLSSGSTYGSIDFRPQNGDLVTPTPDTWTDYCPLPSGCPAGNYPDSYADPLTIGPFEWNPALKGKLNPAGGNSAVTYTSTAMPTGQWTGSGTYSGFVTITYSYDAKTAAEYAQDLLNNAYIKSLTDPVEKSREFYRMAINLRTDAYPGASVNERLRQVEYFGRGFSGSQVLRNANVDWTDSLNDLANAGVHVTEPLYNELKRLGIIGAEDNNPISAPSQSNDARSGFNLGWDGLTLEQAVQQFFGGQSPPPPPPPPAPPELRQPLGLQLTSTTIIPYQLTFVPTNAPNIVSVAATIPADYVVVVSDRAVSSFVVNALRPVPLGFTADFGSNTVAATEGAAVPVPASTNSVQTFTLHNVLPVTNQVALTLNFSQPGTAVIAVSPTQAVDLNTFYGNVSITNISLKLTGSASELHLVARGPSILRPHLQISTNLIQWTTLTNFDGYDGDASMPVITTNHAAFYRLTN